jgi:hypothetical protein
MEINVKKFIDEAKKWLVSKDYKRALSEIEPAIMLSSTIINDKKKISKQI